jgi:uncharacterized membrane protein YsdA (DUF1294 family)
MGTTTRVRPLRVLLILLALAALGVVGLVLPVPVWVSVLFMVASILTFGVYAVDKSAAGGGRRRVPENVLLSLGFLGGWPGALIAQQTLRHKTRKKSFQVRFWLTVAANVFVLIGGMAVTGS